MEKYPDYETYRALYARYHQRGVEDLLGRLKPLENMSVMDLCAGDGRLTLKMLESGARSVLIVDAEAEMVPSILYQHRQVRVTINEIHHALIEVITSGEFFDRIVCQQAVNYWLDQDTARSVAATLNHGGIFVFNTFTNKPSETPRVLQYEFEEHMFVEVSWLADGFVHHVQIRDGMEPHQTSFRWLSTERFRELLFPYFEINEERREKTSLYWCQKK